MPGNNTQKKRSVLLSAVVLMLTILTVFFFYDAHTPRCVEAQTCIPVYPRFLVKTTKGTDGGGCDAQAESVSFDGILKPWMGFKEFDLEYDRSDNHADHFEVTLNPYSFSNSSVDYTITTCLKDRGSGNDYRWRVRYLIARWQ